MAAISGWYLVLLIPSALLVLLVWMLSRQKWGPAKDNGDEGLDATDDEGPTGS